MSIQYLVSIQYFKLTQSKYLQQTVDFKIYFTKKFVNKFEFNDNFCLGNEKY